MMGQKGVVNEMSCDFYVGQRVRLDDSFKRSSHSTGVVIGFGGFQRTDLGRRPRIQFGVIVELDKGFWTADHGYFVSVQVFDRENLIPDDPSEFPPMYEKNLAEAFASQRVIDIVRSMVKDLMAGWEADNG